MNSVSNEKNINVNDREIIRKLVNDKISNDLLSRDIKTKEAAASAVWQLAEFDQKTSGGLLSQEQQRTHSLALSVISKVNLSTQANAYSQNATLGETLTDLQNRLNNSTTGKKPLPPAESLYIRNEISRLSPDKHQIFSALTKPEVAWLALEAEQRHRDLNKFLISVAGPVASPLATTAALIKAPANTVNDLLEVGVGLTAAGGLPTRMGARTLESAPLEPIGRDVSVNPANAKQSRTTDNTHSLKLDHVNGNLEYDYMFDPASSNYPAPQTTKEIPYHIKNSAPNNQSYNRGDFERGMNELMGLEARVKELDRQISQLHDNYDIQAKQGIKNRVVGYFHEALPQLEIAKAQMKDKSVQLEAPKTSAELQAYEARERLLTALNIPEIKNGELVARGNIKQSSQTIARLQTEYNQAMEALWPQNIPVALRAEAPVLFKSNKLNNVYHITNPAGEKINCVSCAEALVDSIKGYPASANRYNDSLFHQINNDILIKAHNIPRENIHTDLTGVEKQMLQWGDGAIAIIAGKRDNFKGHNFVVVNDAGTVKFIDRQADNDLLSPKGISFSEIAIIRVDTPVQRRVNTINTPSDYNPFTASVDYSPGR